MLSTVLTQIQMPRVLGRYGYPRTLAGGLLFLGLPAFFYAYAQTVAPILAVTLVRGVGFGIITVVFAALIVELAPPERRGEALGLLGVAITLPTIFCNSLGLWTVDRFGYEIVFVIGGAAPLLGLVVILGIRSAAPSGTERQEQGPASSRGSGGLPCDASFSVRNRYDGRGRGHHLSAPCGAGFGGVLRGGRAAPDRG
jgi:MFS family permease